MNAMQLPPQPIVVRSHAIAPDYHFVVYALDADLGLKPGLTRADLLDAIRGHVIAQGEVAKLRLKPTSRSADLRYWIRGRDGGRA